MASRIEIRSVTCPPSTPQANAIEVDLSFPPGTVERIEIIVPGGHAGFTGLALAQAHGRIIPASGNVWIVTDDEKITWPVEDFLNTGSWSAFAYNTDVTNPHSWYIRFLVKENAGPVKPPPELILPADIEAAGTP